MVTRNKTTDMFCITLSGIEPADKIISITQRDKRLRCIEFISTRVQNTFSCQLLVFYSVSQNVYRYVIQWNAYGQSTCLCRACVCLIFSLALCITQMKLYRTAMNLCQGLREKLTNPLMQNCMSRTEVQIFFCK